MPSSSNNKNNNSRRPGRRNYTSVANQDVDEDDGDFHDEPIASSADLGTTAKHDDENNNNKNNNKNNSEADEEDGEDLPMSLTILDSAQKKFPIPCDKNWTVGTFKRRSAKIHKVAPAQQRLIFRGKMLTKDDQTLAENKLDTDGLIIHLFPKPRVVVTVAKNLEEAGLGRNNGHGADDDGDSGIVDENQNNGAHIPSIIINQEEQDRRGQILVLGSVEIAESQNNVKMLSLLLVMICALRLMALFSIAMGAVDEPHSDYSDSPTIHNHTGDVPHNEIFDSDFTDDNNVPQEYDVRSWQTQDYFDLLVSGIGFYVGTLGMKATQENTFRLATAYAIGTIIAGIGWNLWNVFEYFWFFEEQMERQNHQEGTNDTVPSDNYPQDFNGDEQPMTRDDFVTVAFFTILMPLFVWFMCCVRAFEFRRLIREAEEEAAERIRNEYLVTNESGGDDGNGDDDEPTQRGATVASDGNAARGTNEIV